MGTSMAKGINVIRHVTLKRYLSDTPCPQGHIGERYTSNDWCVQCAEERNRTHIKERVEISSKYRKKLRTDALEAYGNECACCKETHKEFLTIDHINGGGRKHRKSLGSPTEFLRHLRNNNYPKEFRCLCWNCNCAIGLYGYCPHHPLTPAPSRAIKMTGRKKP